MNIAWATDYEGVGNAYGFTLGNRLGREAAEGAGIAIDPAAPVAVHHCPPHCFRPVAGKANILWTAWEFPELTPVEAEGMRRADAVFVTARFLVDVAKKATSAPVRWVPQGVRAELFAPPSSAERKRSARRRFRCLWVGAPNDRKGWRHVMAAWRAFARDATCELYVKTTFSGGQLPGGARLGNVLVDTRRLCDADMAALYRSAHCFVFPSMGEGFGFTLGEAMASGLPCLYTPATAMADLATPETGYPLRFSWERCFDVDGLDGKRYPLPAASPDVEDIVRSLRFVRGRYPGALRKGRAAAERIRARFTWPRAGAALRRALEEVFPVLSHRRHA